LNYVLTQDFSRQFLLMAKQHHARGEDTSALRMYQLAQPFFPNNEKLANKIASLQEKARRKREDSGHTNTSFTQQAEPHITHFPSKKSKAIYDDRNDDDFRAPPEEDLEEADGSFVFKPAKRKAAPKMKLAVFRDENVPSMDGPPTPRTQHLLSIINSRDVSQIRALKGVGAKKAEAIVSSLCEMDEGDEGAFISDLQQLGGLKGVGSKTVENMRIGLCV
jgi:DNA uptake protein ComE-like DNA-binding protein